MSNKHFSILVALILLPVFGWMVYDSQASLLGSLEQNQPKDLLWGKDGSTAQVVYLFRFADPVYNHSLSTAQIEVLSKDQEVGEHYHVYGLTQAEYGTGTQYEVNWSKHWFKEEYDLWVENLRVDFSYNTVTVYVTNNYPEDSCEFQETLAHENEHVAIHKRVYFQYQKIIEETLAQSREIPLSDRPILAVSVEEGKKRVGELISARLDPVFEKFKGDLTAQQAGIDTPESYASLKQRCGHW